jgi:hypothetical protein
MNRPENHLILGPVPFWLPDRYGAERYVAPYHFDTQQLAVGPLDSALDDAFRDDRFFVLSDSFTQGPPPTLSRMKDNEDSR